MTSTILVVDDNSTNLRVLYDTLHKGGYHVVPAQDAQSALMRLKFIIPDLILLDIMMPGMDGFELYKHIRDYPHAKDTPVMFISAISETETIDHGFALGAVDYITKPFRAAEVLGRVATHLRLKSLQNSLTATNTKLQTLLNRHKCILNAAGEGIFGVYEDGELVFINPYALNQFGFTEAELRDLNIHNVIHCPSSEQHKHESVDCPVLRVAREGGQRVVGTECFYRRDGQRFPVELTISSLNNIDEPPIAVVLFRDITERLKTERQLKESAIVFEVSGEGIFLTDAEGIIQRINPAFSEITGYVAEEVIGKTARVLKSGRHNQEFYVSMWNQFSTAGNWEGEIWNRRKDGSIYPQWEMITAIKDDCSAIVGYVAQFSDITSRKMSEDELRYRGNYDVLTGLANRALMIERLDQAIKEHRRRGRKLGLLFIDLDRFKQVNDTMGHHIGDLLLQQVGARIQQALREIDTAARLGGDEFVVLLMDLANREPVEMVAIRLLDSIGSTFDLEGKVVNVGASIGIAMFPDDGDNLEILLKNADRAMYQAKDSGRHQLHFYTGQLDNLVTLKRHGISGVSPAIH